MKKSNKIYVGVLRKHWLGMAFGLMPFLKFVIPILLMPISIVYGLRNLKRTGVLIGLTGFQYCILQLFLFYIHPSPDSLEAARSEWALMRGFIVLSLVCIPFSNMALNNIIDFNGMARLFYWAIIFCCCAVAGQYFLYDVCRSALLSSNPLIPPFVLLPLFSYIFSRRITTRSADSFDLITATTIFVTVSSFGGNRMALYTAVVLFLLIIFYCSYNRFYAKAFSAVGVLLVGLFLSFVSDYLSGCGFWGRVGNQVDIITGGVEARHDVADFLTLSEKDIVSDQILPSIVSSDSSLSAGMNTLDDEDMQRERTEHSTLQRMVMWSNAFSKLSRFGVEWVYGVGRAEERKIANELTGTNYSHVHNQFLSWIIQGGILLLSSGLLLFGCLLRFSLHSFPVFVFLVSITLGFATNSLLLSSEASIQFILLVMFVQALEVKRRMAITRFEPLNDGSSK